MNWLQISSAIITLAGGSLFYLLERLPGTTYFIPADFSPAVIHSSFGLINQGLPSLLHPLAFILLTVGILGCKTRKGILAASLFWLIVDGLCELLQNDHIAQQLTPLLPSWFDQIVILDNIKTYMDVGRFDPLDLGFIALGSAIAFFIATITRKGGNPDEHATAQTD